MAGRPVTYEQAISLALAAHDGQTDKVGQPYIRHPLRVAERVEFYLRSIKSEADPNDARIVAVLHDVMEDCPDFHEPLRQSVPPPLYGSLLLLTRMEPFEYDAYIEGILASGDEIARAVKLADLADNIERLPAWAEIDPEGHERRRTKYRGARTKLLHPETPGGLF